jgi:hypothetical protein
VQGDALFSSGAVTFSPGVTVDFSGATVLGLGGSVPNPLSLSNSSASPVIEAINFSPGQVALRGVNNAGSSAEIGVLGQAQSIGSNNPAGVVGTLDWSINVPLGGAGVVGNGGFSAGYGVYATSQNNLYPALYARNLSSAAGAVGVLGESTPNFSDAAVGVMGSLQTWPVSPMPQTSTAVYGHGAFSGYGVYGSSSNYNYAGVYGRHEDMGMSGIGVLGEVFQGSSGVAVVGAKQFGFNKNSIWTAVGSLGGGVYGSSSALGDFGVAGYVSGNGRAGVIAVSATNGPGLLAQGRSLGADIGAASSTVTGLAVSATSNAVVSGMAVGLSVTAAMGNFSTGTSLGGVFRARGDMEAVGLSVTAETLGQPMHNGYGLKVFSNRTGILARAVDDFGNSPAGYAVIGEGIRVGVHGLATRTAGGPYFTGVGVLAESAYVALSAVAQDDFSGNSGVALYAAGKKAAELIARGFSPATPLVGASLDAYNFDLSNPAGTIGLSLSARSDAMQATAVGVSINAQVSASTNSRAYGVFAKADNGSGGSSVGYGVLGQVVGAGAGLRGENNFLAVSGSSNAAVQAANKATSSSGTPAIALDIDGGIQINRTRGDSAAGVVGVGLVGCFFGMDPPIVSGSATIINNQITTNSLILLTPMTGISPPIPVTARVMDVSNGSAGIAVQAIGQNGNCPSVSTVLVQYLIINTR